MLQTLICSFIRIWLVIIYYLIFIDLFYVLCFQDILLLLFHQFLSFGFFFDWDFWKVLFLHFVHIFSHNLQLCMWLSISLLLFKMTLFDLIEVALIVFILVWSAVEFLFYLFLAKISMKFVFSLIYCGYIFLFMYFLLLSPFFRVDWKLERSEWLQMLLPVFTFFSLFLLEFYILLQKKWRITFHIPGSIFITTTINRIGSYHILSF